MMDFITHLPHPLAADSRQFFALWNRWRGNKRLPERRDIRLEDFGPLLERHLLLEIRDRERMVFVSAGKRIVDYLGGDIIGRDYLDLTLPENRRPRQQLTLEQLLQPCGALQYYGLQYRDGSMLPAEIACAPVCADGADIPDYLIACCTPLLDLRPAGSADPDSWRMGEGMRFVDLGYGIPPVNLVAYQPALPCL